MDMRIGLLFLLVVSAIGACAARQMTYTYEISVLEIENEEPGKKIQASSNSNKNDQLCTLCEEYASEALKYLEQNKTQTEILSILHRTCSRVTGYEEQCITLVDYYSSLFFSYISSVQSDDFCHKFGLCQAVELFASELQEDSCQICQRTVSELLVKLKDPDTELEIIEILLKACNSVQNYAKKCKKMVFEYGPVILVNAEKFLETNDICTALHACKLPNEISEQAETVLKADS